MGRDRRADGAHVHAAGAGGVGDLQRNRALTAVVDEAIARIADRPAALGGDIERRGSALGRDPGVQRHDAVVEDVDRTTDAGLGVGNREAKTTDRNAGVDGRRVERDGSAGRKALIAVGRRGQGCIGVGGVGGRRGGETVDRVGSRRDRAGGGRRLRTQHQRCADQGSAGERRGTEKTTTGLLPPDEGRGLTAGR